MITLDKELIKKYDKPGPRYTSYPTAPHFTEKFTHGMYIDEIVRTNNPDNKNALSLYFHIPFCDTLCYFCGCNTFITNNSDRVSKYLEYVKEEIDLLSTYIDVERPVAQIHWGGGTPTHLTPEQIRDLKSYINESFNVSENAEQSCEIDPRELTKEHLTALRESGFNRVSLGVQDFNPVVQKAVNRVQPEEITRKVIDWVRELKFESLNLDLIYGLPFQTVDEFEKTVQKIIGISPNRIALFNFAYVPWMKSHMKMIKEETLPGAEEKLDILKMAIEKLTDGGYEFIGMDHFAKPEDDLSKALKSKKLYRNFQGYSTHSGTDLYAFGITGISQHGNVYSQNFKTEKEYYEAIDRGYLPISKGYLLSDDDILRRTVIMKIMCDFELNFASIDECFNINSKEYFSAALKKLQPMLEDNLLTLDEEKLIISEKGRMVIRNIAMCFDGYIERNEDNNKYSKTV
ncbi:MAG: oxygen-independent coproporphyrinogen III oxidase [Rhodothermaceae bacterium]